MEDDVKGQHEGTLIANEMASIGSGTPFTQDKRKKNFQTLILYDFQNGIFYDTLSTLKIVIEKFFSLLCLTWPFGSKKKT